MAKVAELLARQLDSTKNALLIESSTTDSFWGDGPDGSGTNMLGKILMETRTRLRRRAARGVR